MPPLAAITLDALSQRSGVDIGTINAYGRMGLITKPRRMGGLQLYSSNDIARLIFIRRARELGFLVQTIRELLRLANSKSNACREIHEIAERHLADIRRQRSDLERMEKILAPLVSACPLEGPASACPVVSALSHPD